MFHKKIGGIAGILLFCFLFVPDQVMTYDFYQVRFIDAQTGAPIDGAKVIFEKGEEKYQGQTDENGYIMFNPSPFTYDDDRSETITVSARKPGYATLEATCPCFQKEIAMRRIPIAGAESYRIVLNWGKRPKDLDSHLWFCDEHLFSGRVKSDSAGIDRLDHDSYGPETTTILIVRKNCTYTFAVYDNTNKTKANCRALSSSEARVDVYVAGRDTAIKQFYIPRGQEGNKWIVFRMTEEGEIEEINRIVHDPALDGSELTPAH